MNAKSLKSRRANTASVKAQRAMVQKLERAVVEPQPPENLDEASQNYEMLVEYVKATSEAMKNTQQTTVSENQDFYFKQRSQMQDFIHGLERRVLEQDKKIEHLTTLFLRLQAEKQPCIYKKDIEFAHGSSLLFTDITNGRKKTMCKINSQGVFTTS